MKTTAYLYTLRASLVLLTGYGFTGHSLANEALAKKNDCLGCHAVAVKLVGPAFKDVAAKYGGESDAVERLAGSIRNGSVGKWGELPMPAHAKLSEGDARKLAQWVMKAK